MITILVIPKAGHDAYQMLRTKVIHGAQTWSWANKAKTRLEHAREDSGYIKVSSADRVLLAEIHPQDADAYFLVEKFIGRLVAWFEPELFTINLQFQGDDKPRRPKRRRSRGVRRAKRR